MRLFIAEKPSLAQAIASGLGNGKKENGYIVCGNDAVTWCYGHIMEQYQPEDYDPKYKNWRMDDLPIIPTKWKLKVSSSCKVQYNIIRNLVKQADEIVNAGDPDREGQLLVDEVLNELAVFGVKPVKRILLNALDDKSVQEALSHLRDNHEFIGLRNSALARSRADWIIGMNLSRMYSLRVRDAGYSGVISVGRVQTPTMALVVRRENEINNFQSVNYFKLKVTWHHHNGCFSGIWQPDENVFALDSEGRLLDKKIAAAVAEKVSAHIGIIEKVDQKQGQTLQRLPYSLSALQVEAGRKFGYTPQQVLDAQQKLYEMKLMSYPRSDCDYLPTNQLAAAPEILAMLKSLSAEFEQYVEHADLSIHSRAWNDQKVSAHHAIIPTLAKIDFNKLSDIEKNLYVMIAKAYITQFYPPQTYLSTKIVVRCAAELFVTTGRVILHDGWKSLYHDILAEDEEDTSDEDELTAKLPSVCEKESVAYQEHVILDRVTQPPKRFTAATLLKAIKEIYKYLKDDELKATMKECAGIGTEATRANIIETIQQRGFVTLKKKYFIPTEKAYMMVKVLSENITYPDITAQWERSLDMISRREMRVQDFFQQQSQLLDELLLTAKTIKIDPAKDVVKCPKCGKAMLRRKGKKGYFWGCTGYPECIEVLSDQDGKPVQVSLNTKATNYKPNFNL